MSNFPGWTHESCDHSNTKVERNKCRRHRHRTVRLLEGHERQRAGVEQRDDDPSPSQPDHARTEVTERILKYVTDEFNEGRTGNRRSLPSTRDVARECTQGSGAKACRWALRHLHLLMWSGEIVRVKDPDVSPYSRRYVFWALDEPDTRYEMEHKPQGAPTVTVVTALEEPWQVELGRDIDNAETASPH